MCMCSTLLPELEVLERPLCGRESDEQLGRLLFDHGDVVRDHFVEWMQMQSLKTKLITSWQNIEWVKYARSEHT